MKSIFVQNIQEAEGIYVIALGDGTLHSFSNLKAARAFQVSVNNFLTTQLHNFNQVYVELFSAYRNCWGYFYNTKNTTISNNYFNESKIKEAFNSIDTMLDLSCTSYSRQVDYYRVYRDFEQIAINMKLICCELNNEIANKSQSIFSLKINYILTQINNISFEITKFSHADLHHKITNDPLFHAIRHATNLKSA